LKRWPSPDRGDSRQSGSDVDGSADPHEIAIRADLFRRCRERDRIVVDRDIEHAVRSQAFGATCDGSYAAHSVRHIARVLEVDNAPPTLSVMRVRATGSGDPLDSLGR
jgi:hypothetical protein